MRFVNGYVIVLLSMLSAGCSFSLVKPAAESTRQYILESDIGESSETKTDTRSNARDAALDKILYIPDASGSPQVNSNRLWFSRDGVTIDTYKYALWSESVSTRVSTLLARRIWEHGLFRIVTRENAPVPPDFILDCEIVDFLHDARTEPGSFRVGIVTTLTDLKNRRVLGIRSFSATKALKTFDAAGAVEAASSATAEVLRDASRWLAQVEFVQNAPEGDPPVLAEGRPALPDTP